MIQKIRIRNFRSLLDNLVDLKRVNLLIGPNNSGKSNFLNSFEFLHLFYTSTQFSRDTFSRNYSGFWEPKDFKNSSSPISFNFSFKLDEERFGVYIVDIFGTTDTSSPIYRELIGIAKKDFCLLDIDTVHLHTKDFYTFKINVINYAPIDKVCKAYQIDNPKKKEFVLQLNENFSLTIVNSSLTGLDFIKSSNEIHSYWLLNSFEKTEIYQPDINKIKVPAKIGIDKQLKKDTSNLISFLEILQNSNNDAYKQIKTFLGECIDDFTGIRFERIEQDGEFYNKIGLIDRRQKTYWADELSEGTLYFLALLSIIHQPDPPKLLLLEEPEKGIHPRRIHELMQYIFRLAEEKSIQVILTSHSTQLVDEFDDNPESVFIFEMDNGNTSIKNLQTDIIQPSDRKSEKNGFPKIDYQQILGERWFHGFLGGVPG